MERNDDLPAGGNTPTAGASATGGTGGTGGVSGYGDTGDLSGTQGYGAGTGATPATGGGMSEREHGLGNRAREALGGAQERLADVGSTVKDRAANLGSTVRDKAGTAKNSLADALQSGAEKLRQRGQGAPGTPAYAGVAGDGPTTTGTGVATTSQVTERVAGGMQATADWLRDADLETMRTGIERQVKEHPGRTLLIALGLGYVLGKAFRK